MSGIVLSTVRYEAKGEDLFGSWSDIILALVVVAEAAEDNARYHNPVSHKLRRALDQFDFEAA